MNTIARRPGALTISLDFELYWGIRDLVGADEVRDHLLRSREAVERILETFAAFEIHATWATVGFLFANGRDALTQLAPTERPTYTEAALDPYGTLNALGDSEDADPIHFAPSLIARILATPHQELATHTFSHFYALEDGVTPAAFTADLLAAQQAAAAVGTPVESIVFPRNQYALPFLDVLRKQGVKVYRGNPSSWLYAPRATGAESLPRRAARLIDAYANISGNHVHTDIRRVGGLTNVPASRFLRPYSPRLKHLERVKYRRIVSGVHEAAETGGVFHLWWHPHNFGTHTDENIKGLRTVLEEAARLRDAGTLESLTMREVAAAYAE